MISHTRWRRRKSDKSFCKVKTKHNMWTRSCKWETCTISKTLLPNGHCLRRICIRQSFSEHAGDQWRINKHEWKAFSMKIESLGYWREAEGSLIELWKTSEMPLEKAKKTSTQYVIRQKKDVQNDVMVLASLVVGVCPLTEHDDSTASKTKTAMIAHYVLPLPKKSESYPAGRRVSVKRYNVFAGQACATVWNDVKQKTARMKLETASEMTIKLAPRRYCP